MNLPDAATNLCGDKVCKNPGLAGRTAQSGGLIGVLESQDDFDPIVETLLTNVVQGLRRDWLASSALRWSQLYPISELAKPGLEEHVTAFLRELFCSYSQLVAGLEMHLLQLQQGGVVREEALLRLKQLVIHPRDLASYQNGIAGRQRAATNIDSGLDGGRSASDERVVHDGFSKKVIRSEASLNEFEVALEEIHAAYRDRMAELMRGALNPAPPQEAHLEWLADAKRCLAQFRSACDWIERQRQVALPPSTQS